MTSYKTKYFNYRCRKCNKYISKERIYSPDLCPLQVNSMLVKGKYHKCPASIADDERVIFDCISVSDTPLKDAYEIIDKRGNIIINEEN